MTIAPNKDPAGDCGVVVAFQFDDADAANHFAEKAGGWLPINTGRHVYSSWDALIEKRIAHHPDMNPLNHQKNQHLRIHYNAELCPLSLALLSRTVFISMNPDWADNDINKRIATCRVACVL